MTFPETTRGLYVGPLPEGLFAHIESHLLEYGLPIRREGNRLHVTYTGAEAELSLDAARIEVAIRAEAPVLLHQIREGTLYLLDHVCPEAAAGIEWTGAPAASDVPPGFYPATVLSRSRIGANFLRLEMRCAGTAALSAGGGMHFSLLLPPEGRAPVWPRLNARGRTEWPGGADALHRVAYTFVEMDGAQDRFTFDVFLHEGSRASEWALKVEPGTEVAVSGPGGGDFPKGDYIVMAGDETALPAIRRILEHSDPARRGRVLLEIGDAGDGGPMAMPEGIELTWILRGTGRRLWDDLQHVAIPEDAGQPFVWVAAEQDVVRQARAHFRATHRLDRSQCYFSAYWERTGT